MLFIFSLKTASISAFGASYLISEAFIYANRCLVAKTKSRGLPSPNLTPLTRTFILDLNRNLGLINIPIYNHKYYTHLEQPHLSFNLKSLNPIHVLACALQPSGDFQRNSKDDSIIWVSIRNSETIKMGVILIVTKP